MLTAITLQNFRTYKKRTISLHPRLTLIIGPNAIGKTNILEAMYALAIGKSFRAEKEEEVITWEEEIGRVVGKTEEDTLELLVTHGVVGGEYAPKKRFMVNGVTRRLIDFTGKMPAVLFWPEDLSLVIDSPSTRREYLNRVLIQIDREYRRNLYQYEKGLRQRNKVLFFIREGTADRSQLPYWNELLIRTGQYITTKREEFVDFLNTRQHPVQKDRGSKSKEYTLHYDKSIISEERLDQYKNEEISAKTTLVGPHRDDIIFNFTTDDKQTRRELANYGSRGEQRLGVLWCKLGELLFIEEKIGIKPMLFLDDIFSELDFQHQEDVIELITHYQTVMTSADRGVLQRFGHNDLNLIELK